MFWQKNVKGKMVVWAKKNLYEWITEKEYVSLLNFIKEWLKDIIVVQQSTCPKDISNFHADPTP